MNYNVILGGVLIWVAVWLGFAFATIVSDAVERKWAIWEHFLYSFIVQTMTTLLIAMACVGFKLITLAA